MKRITFIIYTTVVAATGLFALVFKQYVNINLESLSPLLTLATMLYAGYKTYVTRSFFYNGKWHSYGDSIDFKYSKSESGEGSFSVYKPKAQADMTNIIPAYAMFIGASLNIPLIVFFDYKIKLWCIGIMLISGILGFLISLPFDIKKTKEAIKNDEARSEQWQKELEEQKRREEMGKWK